MALGLDALRRPLVHLRAQFPARLRRTMAIHTAATPVAAEPRTARAPATFRPPIRRPPGTVRPEHRRTRGTLPPRRSRMDGPPTFATLTHPARRSSTPRPRRPWRGTT